MRTADTPAAATPGKDHRWARVRRALFVLALLAAAAYAAMPPVLAGIARRVLIAQGFTGVRVTVGYPGLRRIRVHALELAGTRAAYAFNLSVRDAEVAYDLAGLRSGRGVAVRVPDATLRLEPAPEGATAAAWQPTTVPLPGRWVAAFPLQEAIVERVRVDWRRLDAAGTVYARGAVRRRGAHLHARVRVADRERRLSTLTLDLSEAGALDATLMQPDTASKPILRVRAALGARDGEPIATEGSVDAEPAPLLSLLSPWLAPPRPAALRVGRLKAYWRGKGTARPPVRGKDTARSPRAADGVSVHLSAAGLEVEDLWTPEAYLATLSAELTEAARIVYQSGAGGLATGGVALIVSAPAIEPMFAAIGSLEHVRIAARLAPGPLIPLPPLTVDEATVAVLGGRVLARGARYDGRQETNQFAIDLEGLDIARIVAIERQLGVEASGVLDGHLPFSLTPRGFTITGGWLRARSPGGVVRYTPTESARAMAESSPSMKLVQEALGNYQYARLEADVAYSEGGDLALRVALAGQNPDWNAGQPINLNLDLSDNIPTRLRSLSLPDDIRKGLERRVRERAQRKR